MRRTKGNLLVYKKIENKSKIGEFIDVQIDTIKVNNLSGELVEYSR